MNQKRKWKKKEPVRIEELEEKNIWNASREIMEQHCAEQRMNELKVINSLKKKPKV